MVFTNSAEAFSRCFCPVAKVPLGIPDLFPAQPAGRGEEGRPEEGRLEGALIVVFCWVRGAGCGARPGSGPGSGVATPASRLPPPALRAHCHLRSSGGRSASRPGAVLRRSSLGPGAEAAAAPRRITAGAAVLP